MHHIEIVLHNWQPIVLRQVLVVIIVAVASVSAVRRRVHPRSTVQLLATPSVRRICRIRGRRRCCRDR